VESGESACVRSPESGGQFCVCALQSLSGYFHLIYFINKFYKYCTFSAIFKDNAAINCITVRHRNVYSRQL
jgi:hypothetical protein